MALTPVQVRNNALDDNLVAEQMAVAFAFAARTVLAEGGAVANHAARAAFARTVIADPQSAARQWRWLILTDSNLTAGGLLAGVPTAIASAWDLMAGV